MEMIRVPNESWVVVADGAKALFLKNAGDAGRINLQVVETLAQDNLKDHDIRADRPGQAPGGGAAGVNAMEETDFKEAAEADFLKSIAQKLSEMAYAKDLEQVVIVAPPKALGLMRPYYSGILQDAITAEIAKDLVKMPVDQIEQRLAS